MPNSTTSVLPSTRLWALQLAVATAAAALGATAGLALRHGRWFSVEYTTPTGATVRTEPAPCARRAALRYEKALQDDYLCHS